MTDNLIAPFAVLLFPLFAYSYKFIIVNADKEERTPVLGFIFLFSLVISIIIKLFFMEKAPSFFEEVSGMVISFSLTFMILTLIIFIFVFYIKMVDKALSP